MNKQHIKNLIEFIFEEVISAGGDGDAIWYTRYYKLSDILEIVNNYNSNLMFPFNVEIFDTYMNITRDQESIIITIDEKMLLNSPDFIQFKLRY